MAIATSLPQAINQLHQVCSLDVLLCFSQGSIPERLVKKNRSSQRYSVFDEKGFYSIKGMDIQQTFNNAANCDYFFHQTSRDLSL